MLFLALMCLIQYLAHSRYSISISERETERRVRKIGKGREKGRRQSRRRRQWGVTAARNGSQAAAGVRRKRTRAGLCPS